MLRRLPAFPYPPERKGYWYPATSTINWCEEDYYASIYSAEFVNAFTNILFLSLGIRGLRNCRRHGHDTIFTVSFLGYILVGSGSFLFHSTLKYPMQLIDELSMIYTTCIMCYACFSFGASRRFSHVLAAGLVALSAFITVYYHYLQDPSFHQNVYALLTTIVLVRSVYVMEANIRPSRRVNYGATLQRELAQSNPNEECNGVTQRDEQILRNMWWMFGIGLSVFLGGFALWTLENKYCSVVRGWRHRIGLPWGIVLEGHGWWHLMTGTGAYFYLVWGIWLRHCLNGRQDEYALSWPSIFSMPDIIATPAHRARKFEHDKSSDISNGYAKKAK